MNPSNPLSLLIDGYSFVVLVAVIVSWLQLPPNHPLVHYTRLLTEPALAPIRQLMPSGGGLDFSPLILLLLLRLLRGLF